jgi:ParB-like chromosome segregation protein Spo0J
MAGDGGRKGGGGLRDLGRKGSEIYLIPLDLIDLDENYRKIDLADPEERAATDLLKRSIAANGVLSAGWGRTGGGRTKLVAGQRRLICLRELVAEGHPIEPVMPIKSVAAGPEDTRIAIQLAENIHRDPSPIDNGNAFRKLIGYNWTLEKIEELTGYKPAYVNQCLALADTPVAVQAAVQRGDVTPAAAVQATKKHGDDAPKVLQGKIDAAQAAGKKTVTRTKSTAAITKPDKLDAIGSAAQAAFDALRPVEESEDFMLTRSAAYALGLALFGPKDARVRALATQEAA